MIPDKVKEAGFQEQDEDLVNRLGVILHQVLKDNNLPFEEKKRGDENVTSLHH